MLDEQAMAMVGEAEGMASRPAGGGVGGYAANMTATEAAQAGGLLPPPGGWPLPPGVE